MLLQRVFLYVPILYLIYMRLLVGCGSLIVVVDLKLNLFRSSMISFIRSCYTYMYHNYYQIKTKTEKLKWICPPDINSVLSFNWDFCTQTDYIAWGVEYGSILYDYEFIYFNCHSRRSTLPSCLELSSTTQEIRFFHSHIMWKVSFHQLSKW